MKLIEAKSHHVPGITELWKELMDYHGTLHHLYTRRPNGHVNFSNWVEECIEDEEVLVMVAVDDDRVIAYSIAKIMHHPPVFEIDRHGLIMDMMVDPGIRREGIGERLLEINFGWFRAREIYRVELNVAPNNSIGYNFWTKHGFRDYLHVMWKDIE